MINPKLIEVAEELIELAKKYSEQKEIKIKPDPIKECIHEPKEVNQRFAIPLHGIYEADVIYLICKHCRAKIKAEKWVEA